MIRRSGILIAALLLASEPVYCLVQAYKVEPKTAEQSGWTRGSDASVSQVITCNFDSLSHVELFAGKSNAGGEYRCGVWGDGTELMHSGGVQGRDHNWVRFGDWSTQARFTKGKQYEFRFTRSGSDSIQYYTRVGTEYPYGFLRTGGQDHNSLDLACRVYGRMRAVADSVAVLLVAAACMAAAQA